MPRGEKSGNRKVKPHRARRLAEGMKREGATRAEANRIATAAMDREYATRKADNSRKKAKDDEQAHDARTGQRKTQLTTRRGPAVSGARKPSAAKQAGSGKRGVKATGRPGGATTGRKPRAASASIARQPNAKRSSIGTRPPIPRKAA
jgi:hypothetical protein